MNHAIELKENGGPEVLQWVDKPLVAPGPGQVRVKNHAVGLNFIDIYVRSGLYPVTEFPCGLGTEGAGVVDAIGADVSGLAVGDRVAYAQGPLGAYSQYHCLPADKLVRLPESIGFDTAAAMMLKGLTVQYLLRQCAPLKTGDVVLFHAAAGGVGLIACQWARALGVKLIGTVSSAAKADLAKANGAWATINYSHEDVAQRVHELTEGRGCDVVYDSVGKDTWLASLDCLKPRGLMVSFGNASGPVTGVDLAILNQKGSLFVTRPSLNGYADTPARLQMMADDLFDVVEKGQVNIRIGQRFALKDAALAQQALASRQTTGSTVLLP
ncbi:quinone oxidoreductase family protein [Gallaecimonas sp. GXIMD1310]|uniref:quinone oxidoreductase family protein n=1 Tax=Gallaecimonas sp. GXIMD1310 TaxID=3131926 RepID=UPI003247B064